MKITLHNIKWASRWLPQHYRIWWHFIRCPVFTMRLIWRRIAFTFTRRLIGRPLKSPLTGNYIDNLQTLICYWAIFIVRELDHPSWKKGLVKETAPVVFDIGSNMGVFSDYVKYLNSNAEVISFDPLPESNSTIKAAVGTWPQVVLRKAPNGGVGAGIFAEGEEFVCAGIPLDTYLSARPMLIKIDVDGMEQDVVESGLRTLGQARYVIIESSPDNHEQLINRFSSLGFDRVFWNKTEDLIFWKSHISLLPSVKYEPSLPRIRMEEVSALR